MKLKTTFSLSLFLLALITLLTALPAHADLIVSVTSATVAPGSLDNSLDVNLTNTGSTGVTIGTFSFGVSVTDLDITFTKATTSTVDPYIFAGDSLFGPEIDTSNGQTLIASDIFDLAPAQGATVAAGATVGLGHVLFDVAPLATPGVFTASLVSLDTSLSDPTGSTTISIDQLNNGQITIATPEASSLFFLGACGLLLLLKPIRQRMRQV